MYIFTYICGTYIHIYTYVYTYTFTRIHIYIYVYVYVHIHICGLPHTWYAYVSMHAAWIMCHTTCGAPHVYVPHVVRIRVYMYMYMYTRTYVYR